MTHIPQHYQKWRAVGVSAGLTRSSACSLPECRSYCLLTQTESPGQPGYYRSPRSPPRPFFSSLALCLFCFRLRISKVSVRADRITPPFQCLQSHSNSAGPSLTVSWTTSAVSGKQWLGSLPVAFMYDCLKILP